MSEFDVIAIGDTTQDIFLEMSDVNVQCDINEKNCQLCFDYADKIAVDKKTDIAAVGNAANNAIGVARLGLRSAIYTVVGEDDQGRKAEAVFKENGVDPSYLSFDKEHGTNLSVVVNVKAERTIFVFHEPRQYQVPDMSPPEWIYLTSASGGGVEMMHEQVGNYLVKNPGVKLAFNPGTYQMKLGKDKLRPLLERTDILFLNREESARVLGVEIMDVKELVQAYHDIGVKVMVMTDGPDGSYVSDGKMIWQAGIYDGPVVERTGAGDSYGAGFLSAVIKGKTYPEAMNWGNANSTSVVQFIGAREGLLTEEKLQTIIADNPEVVAKEFN